MKQFLEKSKTQIIHYKNSKIMWSVLGYGLMTIIIGKDLDSEIKVLTFLVGIYLVFSQIVEYITGKLFNTNILAITDKSLIDLNGRIKIIEYRNIKVYENKSDSIFIQENYGIFKIKKNDFDQPIQLVEIIDEILNRKEREPADK